MFKLLPNVSISLEQIHVSGTSVRAELTISYDPNLNLME